MYGPEDPPDSLEQFEQEVDGEFEPVDSDDEEGAAEPEEE